MNERGIISITALCMMLILSMMIAAVANMSARQADITRYIKLEYQLQCAADSSFNEIITTLATDSSYGGKIPSDDDLTDIFYLSVIPDYSGTSEINGIPVSIYLKKYHFKNEYTPTADEDMHYYRIFIITIAEKANYNYNKYSSYQSVYGYMERKFTTTHGTNEIVDDGKYEFKGYLY